MRSLVTAGLLIALVGLLLAFTSTFQASYGLPKLLCLATGATVAWLGVTMGLFSGALAPRRTPLDGPLAACIAALLLSSLFSWDGYLSFMGYYDEYFCALLPLALCAVLFYAVAYSAIKADLLFRATLAAGLLCSCYGILQWLQVVRVELPQGRIISTLGSPVYLGGTLIVLAAPALLFALSRKGWDRALGVWTLALGSAAVVLTRSRGPLIATAAAVVVFLALSGRLKATRKTLAAGVLLALAVTSAFGWMAWSRQATGRSDSERMRIWAIGANAFRRHPWLGTGPDTFKMVFRRYRTLEHARIFKTTTLTQSNAHNDLIQVLATMGLAGGAAYLWLLLAWVGWLRRRLADPSARDQAAAIGAALAALFIQAKVDPTPLTALGLASAFTGLMAAPANPAAAAPTAPPRPASTSVRLACAVVLAGLVATTAFVVRQCQADAYARRGILLNSASRHDLAVRAILRALHLAPRSIQYRAAYFNYISSLALSMNGPARLEHLQQALTIAKEGVRILPQHVESFQLYGAALIRLKIDAGIDRLAEAEVALDQAQLFDPTFFIVLKQRAWIAKIRNEEDKFQRIVVDLSALHEATKDDASEPPR